MTALGTVEIAVADFADATGEAGLQDGAASADETGVIAARGSPGGRGSESCL